ncbi:MAG: serine hydrolase [Lachnospiraceae bacterium]|nr:serine hydrolase [Lachnospiraceae bacterium]
MKTTLQKINSFILSVILVCSILPVQVNAAYEIPGICQVQTDTGASGTVKTMDYSYDHNTYFSLRDIAMILKDTDKSFSLEITKNAISLNSGGGYAPVGMENAPWENNENPNITLRRNEFALDGQKVHYYTLIMALPPGDYDCFIMAADLAMILDVNITVPSAGLIQIDTQTPFSVSPAALEESGYFYGVNGVLAGNATTGEIYYEYQSDTPYPIASTSKLMTCLLTMEAVSAKQLAFEEQVTISDAVAALSASDDGVIALESGQQITVNDLLLGALLPSSNECALCLAETIAGSEEAFVQMMNRKASELGLSQAVFFNCHGLPSFTETPIPAKCQNRMSAEDMFRLVSYLLKVYPQITDITSQKTATLQSLGLEVRNTNPLLHNLPEATGLKTGTTNKSGACLVTSLTADDGAMAHDLVVIVFGTEDSIERGRVSALLARYALQTFHTGAEKPQSPEDNAVPGSLPTNAEAAVDRILRTARKHG